MPLLTNAAGWSATWEMTESCATTSCEVLSGSAFVFMRIACYRWNLLHKCIIYLRGFLPRSQACVVRHAVRDSERKGGQDGATHASGGNYAPVPLSWDHHHHLAAILCTHACTHTHTHTHTHGRHNCQVPRQPAHHPVPRMLYCLWTTDRPMLAL